MLFQPRQRICSIDEEGQAATLHQASRQTQRNPNTRNACAAAASMNSRLNSMPDEGSSSISNSVGTLS
jgi:hypothetical protein